MGTAALIFVASGLLLVFLVLLLAALAVRQLPRRRSPPLDLEFVDVEGWRLRYHRSGRGPTLVLLHGIGANLHCWRDLIPYLNHKYDVVALDLPGFGQSSPQANARYGLDDQAKRLHAFLNQLGIMRAVIVGNSMGANIALWYALNYSLNTRAVVVIAPASSPGLVPLAVPRLSWLAAPAARFTTRGLMNWAHRRTVSKVELVDRERVEETYRTYGRNPAAVRAFLLATDAIRDTRLNTRLKELSAPLLILWGSKDRLVPRRVIRALEAMVPAHQSFVHLGGGHHLQEDEPAWVAEKIDAFTRAIRD